MNSAKNEVGRLESVVRKKQKNLDDLCSEESTSNIDKEFNTQSDISFDYNLKIVDIIFLIN